MNFLRLHDGLLSVLFENEDILAIDKPYGFNAHTNDSKIEHSEFIQDGLIEIYEKNFGQKLHIIHRLDQTTTGVMIFGKSVDSAKKYAEFFFQRKVKKTYLFITSMRSIKQNFNITQKVIHKAKELDAETDLQFLKRTEKFELWQALPHTGRNHQIRIHAKAAELSILGDHKYGGEEYPFLCLHNSRMEFPNGIVLEAKAPIYFHDLKILEDVKLSRLFFELDRRQRLLAKADSNQCFRVSNKFIDFSIDQFGETMVVDTHQLSWSELDIQRFGFFARAIGKKLIMQSREAKNKVLSVVAQTWVAKEREVRYEIHGGDGDSNGLILNQRLHRHWIQSNSSSKKVLNLFSQNGTSSLAAALGGAKQVVTISSSKKNLEWSKRNFDLNQVALEPHLFFCRDSFGYLDQCILKGLKFDLIICDAPSFYRKERGVFKIEKNIEELIASCFKCLNPDGELLFSTSSSGLMIGDIRDSILSVQKKQKTVSHEVHCILPALDFELPEEKVALKSFLLRK